MRSVDDLDLAFQFETDRRALSLMAFGTKRKEHGLDLPPLQIPSDLLVEYRSQGLGVMSSHDIIISVHNIVIHTPLFW